MKLIKFSNNTLFLRSFRFMFTMIPIFIVLIFVDDYKLLMETGYLVFLFIYGLFVILNFFILFIDWDVFVAGGKNVIMKRGSRTLIVKNPKKIFVKPIPILSMGMMLFKLNIDNYTIVFKSKKHSTIFNQLFISKQHAFEIENKLMTLLKTSRS